MTAGRLLERFVDGRLVEVVDVEEGLGRDRSREAGPLAAAVRWASSSLGAL